MVPELCAVQVVPPLLVARMVPLAPTAQPWLVSLKVTPSRYLLVPELCGVQVAPPLLVAKIMPPTPTAQPWLASTNLTPPSSLPCGSGFCHSQLPSPVLTSGLTGPGAPMFT